MAFPTIGIKRWPAVVVSVRENCLKCLGKIKKENRCLTHHLFGSFPAVLAVSTSAHVANITFFLRVLQRSFHGMVVL